MVRSKYANQQFNSNFTRPPNAHTTVYTKPYGDRFEHWTDFFKSVMNIKIDGSGFFKHH